MNPFEAITQSRTAIIAMVVWGAALIFVIGAVFEARGAAVERARADFIRESAPGKVVIESKPLQNTDYQKMVGQLIKAYPNLIINARGDLRLAARKAEFYPEWVQAIYDVMSSTPNARWEAKEMCAGADCRGSVFSVALTAVKKFPVPQGGKP